jgi:fructoselysine-6-P-deglycase FrlB-like protein
MPTLVIKSIVGNAESFASCEEDPKEYQTLQSLITESEQALEEKEDSGNEIDDDDILFVSGERPVLLAAQNKEHETTTDSSKEESEPGEVDFSVWPSTDIF